MAALAIIGGIISAVGSIAQGVAANNAAKAQAQAMEIRADEERAVGQREAIRRAKEAKLVLSRQQAVAAASGGGTGDPTIVNLMSGVAQEGAYQSGVANWKGETSGQNYDYQADIRRMEGRNALIGGFIGGASSIFNGFSNFVSYQPMYKPPPNPTYAPAGSGYYY